MDVAQSHVNQRFQLLGDFRYRLEEIVGFADGHLQHIIDALSLIFDGKGVVFVSFASAFITDNMYGRHEVHFNDLDSRTFAFFAPSSRYIE